MFLLTLKPSLSAIVPPHRNDLPPKLQKTKALDAGAGIGRVTQNTLLPLFDRVDLVETSAHFLQKAVDTSPKWPGIASGSKGVRFWQCGLQHFDPSTPSTSFAPVAGSQTDWEEGLYDIVWIQWCAGHLSDDDLVAFLRRCRQALRPDQGDEISYICVKENITRQDKSEWDDDDSSITRSDGSFKQCFRNAGLTLVCEETQGGFPPELFPVKMCESLWLSFL